jgi:hypothetical protein
MQFPLTFLVLPPRFPVQAAEPHTAPPPPHTAPPPPLLPPAPRRGAAASPGRNEQQHGTAPQEELGRAGLGRRGARRRRIPPPSPPRRRTAGDRSSAAWGRREAKREGHLTASIWSRRPLLAAPCQAPPPLIRLRRRHRSTSTAIEVESNLLPLPLPPLQQARLPLPSRPGPASSFSLACGRLECIRGERRGKIASPLSWKAVCLHRLPHLLEDLPRVNSGNRRGKMRLPVAVGLSPALGRGRGGLGNLRPWKAVSDFF